MFRNPELNQMHGMRFCKEDSCYGVAGNGYLIKIYQKPSGNINGKEAQYEVTPCKGFWGDGSIKGQIGEDEVTY